MHAVIVEEHNDKPVLISIKILVHMEILRQSDISSSTPRVFICVFFKIVFIHLALINIFFC